MDIAQAMNRIATKIIISDNVAMLLSAFTNFDFVPVLSHIYW